MRITVLEYEGKNYPLCYSLEAAKKIEDEYVSADLMGDAFINPGKFGFNSIDLVKGVIYILAQEGIAYCKFKNIKNKDDKNFELDIPEKEEMFRFAEYDTFGILIDALTKCFVKSKKKQ